MHEYFVAPKLQYSFKTEGQAIERAMAMAKDGDYGQTVHVVRVVAEVVVSKSCKVLRADDEKPTIVEAGP